MDAARCLTSVLLPPSTLLLNTSQSTTCLTSPSTKVVQRIVPALPGTIDHVGHRCCATPIAHRFAFQHLRVLNSPSLSCQQHIRSSLRPTVALAALMPNANSRKSNLTRARFALEHGLKSRNLPFPFHLPHLFFPHLHLTHLHRLLPLLLPILPRPLPAPGPVTLCQSHCD